MSRPGCDAMPGPGYTDAPVSVHEILRYEVANPEDTTNKWNIVREARPAPAGDYRTRAFVIVGTLDSVRAAMMELYALHPADTAPPTGHLDVADCARIEGWAGDPDLATEPIEVAIYERLADGSRRPLLTLAADRYRPDLEAAGTGDGIHAFGIDTAQVLGAGTGPRVIELDAVNPSQDRPDTPLIPARAELNCP